MPSSINPNVIQEDYLVNKRFLKGSMIQDVLSYQTNFSHTDLFYEPQKDPKISESAVVGGFDLAVPRQYNISLNLTSNYNLYVWGKFSREIQVTPSGTYLVG